MLVPLNITGGSYEDKSRPLSSQVTRNLYPKPIDNPFALSKYVLQTWPGKTLFGTAAGADGGLFAHNGVAYKVTGTTLYSVASDGTHTSLGTVAGAGRCWFEGFGSGIVVLRGGVPYYWDGSTFSTVTDPNLETPNGATHINNQMIYDGDGARFCSSDVGDPTTINGLNYATAESNADDILIPYAFDQYVYMFGNETIEPWWNSGVGNPPVDRVEGGIMNVGLAAIHSVSSNKDWMYFLGTDDRVYQAGRGSLAPISDKALSHTISEYSTKSDAVGWCFTFEGENFYQLLFPAENKTFVYPEGGQWFELSSGSSGGRSIENSYAYCYGKHLVSDYRNGDIYYLDDTVFTEGGNEIIRIRDTAPLHGGMFGMPGKRLEMNRFELIMESGVGTSSGQGLAPVVMLSFSDDGGKTFSTETWGTVGAMGEFMWKIEWFALGSFDTRVIRIRMSDPVECIIYSAAADIEAGI